METELLALPTQPTHIGRVTLRFGDAMVGRLHGVSASGEPQVDFPGNPALVPLMARSCVDVHAPDVGREVLLVFDGGDPAHPVIVGLLRPPQAAAALPAHAPAVAEFSAGESLTLRCGAASITLTSDGQVMVRGAKIHTRSSGLNRIQGASVRIN